MADALTRFRTNAVSRRRICVELIRGYKKGIKEVMIEVLEKTDDSERLLEIWSER